MTIIYRTVETTSGIARVYFRNGQQFGGGNNIELTKQQRMDLMSCKQSIKEKSKIEKNKTFYINVDDEGEFSISNTFDRSSSAYAYKNGGEIALPNPSDLVVDGKVLKPKTKVKTIQPSEDDNLETSMETKTKKVAKKTGTKAAKKVSKKSVAPGTAYGPKVSVADKKTLSVTEITKALKAGKTVRKASDGYYLSLGFLKGKEATATYEVVVKESKRKK